jgi:hypothetical protein
MNTAQEALNHWVIKMVSTMTRVVIPQLRHDDGSESSKNERVRQIDLFKAEIGQKLISFYAPIAAGASTVTYAGYNLSLESEGFKESNSIDFAIITAGSAVTLGILALKNFVDTQCEYAKNYKGPSVIVDSASPVGLHIDQLHQALDSLKSQGEKDNATIQNLGVAISQLKENNNQLQDQLLDLQAQLSANQSSSINYSSRK